MSDFRPSQIAPYLEKSAKQLVRWCEQELVPGAVRTAGGHWRISGESLQSVVEAVRSAAPTNTRRRRENAYPTGFAGRIARLRGMTPRQAWSRVDAAQLKVATGSRKVRLVGFSDAPAEAYDLRSPSDRARFLRRAVELFHRNAAYYDNVEEEAEKLWPETARLAGQTFKQSISATAVARSAGIPLRTFYRWFPGWRRAVFEGTRLADDNVTFEEIGKDRSAPVAVVPFDYEAVDAALAG